MNRLDVPAGRGMLERNISRAQVIRTITQPDRVFDGSKPGRKAVKRDTSIATIVRVVYTAHFQWIRCLDRYAPEAKMERSISLLRIEQNVGAGTIYI